MSGLAAQLAQMSYSQRRAWFRRVASSLIFDPRVPGAPPVDTTPQHIAAVLVAEIEGLLPQETSTSTAAMLAEESSAGYGARIGDAEPTRQPDKLVRNRVTSRARMVEAATAA